METRLKVDGMSCAHCAATVRGALAAVPGVTAVVDVDLAGGQAVVAGNPDLDDMTTAVAAAGFDATVQ
jgi:copper chaperone CopZ